MVFLAGTFVFEGAELLAKNDHEQALPRFETALQKATIAKDMMFVVLCKSKIGECKMAIGEFSQGLASLESACSTADSIQQVIDGTKRVDDATQRRITFYASNLGPDFLGRQLRKIHYLQLGCLEALGRITDANQLAQSLVEAAQVANDEKLLCDLERDGWWEN